MDLNEIVGLLPEDKREAVKTELSAYVPIRSREDAERLAREHPHIKSVFDSGISKAVASHDERFIAEKVPSLVEAEIAKRNPAKDPRDAKLAEMEAKLKDMEKQTVREKQTALAMKLAAEKKLPVDIVTKFIGDNDEATTESINQLSGALMPWMESMVKEQVTARVGDNGTPKRGSNPNEKETLQKQYNDLIKQGRREEANLVMIRLNRL